MYTYIFSYTISNIDAKTQPIKVSAENRLQAWVKVMEAMATYELLSIKIISILTEPEEDIS